MALCREILLVKHGWGRKTARCLKCRTWGCEICLPDRIRDLKGLCRRGEPTTFLTLTYNANRPGTPDEHARELGRAWKNLRERIKKKYNLKRIPYLTVYEATKNGEPHLHIMLRIKYISQLWLSDQMRDLIDSPIVDIKRIYNQRKAAWYIAKYISKGPHRFEGCKRYYRSQNFEVKKDKWTKPVLNWDEFYTRKQESLEKYCREMENLGWSVTIKGDRAELRKGPPPPASYEEALASS